MRTHEWLSLPRIKDEKCLAKLNEHNTSLWVAIFRGRIPALVKLKGPNIANFMPPISKSPPSNEWRLLMFDAILNGDDISCHDLKKT